MYRKLLIAFCCLLFTSHSHSLMADDFLESDLLEIPSIILEMPSYNILDVPDFNVDGYVHKKPFTKGSWTIQTYASTTQFGKAGEIHAGHVGLGYFFEENASISLEWMGGYIDGNNSGSQFAEDGGIWGIELFLRKYFYKDKDLLLFIEIGAGLITSENSFPGNEGGTHTNFAPGVGLGMHYRLEDDFYLTGGVRWHHVSNAGRTELNPGYDGALFFIGFTKTF